MRYLITAKEPIKPFFSNWFDIDNFFNKEQEMVVYDLHNQTYTTDGNNWQDIEFDNL